MTTSKGCSKCEKETGAYFCTGCEAYFCKKDYQHHREKMTGELDRLISDRNDLQDQVNNAIQDQESNSSLLKRIDEIKVQLMKFSQELIRLKENENFVEYDLKRLEQTLHQLKQELERMTQASDVELPTKQSNQIPWDTLIYGEEKSVHMREQEVNKQEQTRTSSYRRKLVCKGYSCSTCGNCCDWYYCNNYYAKRNGATCNRDYVSNFFLDDALSSIYDDTLYSDNDSLYHGMNMICKCQQNN
ncbi:unnamed protein product [Rotaria sp. Silwood1]|nr:unnamed protein product [Rotaria sp. Silwood1]